MQPELFIPMPPNLEGLIQALERIEVCEGSRMKQVLKEFMEEVERDMRIWEKYHRELNHRKGESEQIREELALEFFNTPTAKEQVKHILYRKYK